MARIKGPKKTNRYPDEFKIKAVQLAEHPDILAKADEWMVWATCSTCPDLQCSLIPKGWSINWKPNWPERLEGFWRYQDMPNLPRSNCEVQTGALTLAARFLLTEIPFWSYMGINRSLFV